MRAPGPSTVCPPYSDYAHHSWSHSKAFIRSHILMSTVFKVLASKLQEAYRNWPGNPHWVTCPSSCPVFVPRPVSEHWPHISWTTVEGYTCHPETVEMTVMGSEPPALEEKPVWAEQVFHCSHPRWASLSQPGLGGVYNAIHKSHCISNQEMPPSPQHIWKLF